MNKISLILLAFCSCSAYGDVLDIMKEKGVLLDQQDVRVMASLNGSPCNHLVGQTPGTYLFTQSSQEGKIKLCYVDDKGKIKSDRLKVRGDHLRSKEDSKYLSLDQFLKANSSKLKNSSLATRSLADDINATPNDLKKAAQELVAPKACPKVLPPLAGGQEQKNLDGRIRSTNGSIINRNLSETPKSLIARTPILPCEDLEREKGISPGKDIAKGSYGSIKEACFGDSQKKDCDWVTKSAVVARGQKYSEKELNDFFKEASIFKELDPSISPQMIDAYVCKAGDQVMGKFVMKRMDGDLFSYLNSHEITQEDLTKIMQVIKQFHASNMVHQDLHSNNILYKMGKDGKPEFYISDFGLSHHYRSEDPNEKSLKVANFRNGGGGGSKNEQIKYDYESIISDLKTVFGIDIKLETSVGTIEPKPLPKGTTRVNQALLRKKMSEAMNDPNLQMDDQVIVFGAVRAIDHKLMSAERGELLEKHSKMTGIVIDVRN